MFLFYILLQNFVVGSEPATCAAVPIEGDIADQFEVKTTTDTHNTSDREVGDSQMDTASTDGSTIMGTLPVKPFAGAIKWLLPSLNVEDDLKACDPYARYVNCPLVVHLRLTVLAKHLR